ncbi:hypothetical protein [Rhodococcus sp. B10]|uniref:hypothetical protein n=1 Tax=Rhodococcus sp. B10 TaxID=2695876 RepID=UPI0016AB203A|nr:hypothetical protein [Rhodococcus sp. B10]NIL78930.1 hypothetical protein [Rhodococcus sp. B10]
MGLRRRLLLLAGSLAVFNLVLWGIPKLAPEVPGKYEGVAGTTSPRPAGSVVRTTDPPLPSGFPSMEFPPPKIDVPDGQPQPIATKFGLTYDIPADWDNWYDGFAGWESEDGSSMIYGAVGFYERRECHDGEYSALAMTGMTGRPADDLDMTARTEVEKALSIYADGTGVSAPSVTIDGPQAFDLGGQPAVRYRANVENIPQEAEDCTPPAATFDVVATPGHATAATALFLVQADRGVDNALRDSQIDDIISSIRRS